MTPVSIPRILRCNSIDGVAVALVDLRAGETVSLDGKEILSLGRDPPWAQAGAKAPFTRRARDQVR